jgi:uncharacterized membrane protein
VAPSREDPVVRAASPAVGGPLGTRAGRHPWWTPARVVLLLTAVAFALGMVQKLPCAASNWNDLEGRYAQMCYSDLPYLYTGRGLAEGNWPYSADPQVRARYPEVMEYPPVISYWAWGTARVTQVLTGSPDLSARVGRPVEEVFGLAAVQREIRWYVVVNALGLALVTLVAAAFLVGVNPRRPWDAAAFAVLPALALSGLVNWDLLAVAMVAGALWAWTRGRPVLTGVLIGVGTATKLYPLFLLGGVLVLCLRGRRWRDLALTSGATAAAWLAANAPALLTGPEQWRVFWDFNADRGADLGSLWLVARDAGVPGIDAGTINTVSWLFFLCWCLGVAALGLRAPVTPRLAQLGFLVVAGFLLVNKVYSPQYVLWLLPLAVLARPRWRDLLVWQAGEVVYFAAVWWYLGGLLDPSAGGRPGAYWIAICLRVLGELWLVAMVARDVARPEHDPVDRGSDDADPVDVGGREADPDVDLVADRGDARARG